VPALLASGDAFGFLEVWLGVTAGVYLGLALQDGRGRALGVEVVGVALFAALGPSRWSASRSGCWPPGISVTGCGTWSITPAGSTRPCPGWWVPGCLGYDAVLGAYTLIRFL
jgi:hypothetical protein